TVTLKPTPVQYHQLGSSGLRVSEPILGAMSFGSPKWLDWVLDEEHSLPTPKAAWDKGINTIDIANVYSSEQSERIIGVFMEKIIVATKCHRIVGEATTVQGKYSDHVKKTRDYVNQWGLSRAVIFNIYDDLRPPEETMKALHDLVQSENVRYIDASTMPKWVNYFCEHAVQVFAALLRRVEEREMFDYCSYHRIGIILGAPVARGYLTRSVDESTKPKLTEADKIIIDRVEDVAKRCDVSMAEVALAWVSSKVVSPIVGISSIKRLEENIVGVGRVLSETQMQYLEEA
ncbi:NADP-dependent oxidoreductase domain-containing protein, partial [Armillaria novae-zelandiae]